MGMLLPKQWKNVAQVLHNNRVKIPKDFFAIVLSTNMAAVTPGAIHYMHRSHNAPLPPPPPPKKKVYIGIVFNFSSGDIFMSQEKLQTMVM